MRYRTLCLLVVSLCVSCLLATMVAQANSDVSIAITVPSISGRPSSLVTSVHQWTVDRMLVWMPPGHSQVRENIHETPEEGKTRYEEMADDAISVAFNPNEKPLFEGKYGRSKTLAVMMALSFFESGYRMDVDTGVGTLSRGDHGNSWCLMQVNLGKERIVSSKDGVIVKSTKDRIMLDSDFYSYTTDPSVGYGGRDLVENRRICYTVGLHMIRRSFKAGALRPVDERLRVYAGNTNEATEKSKVRIRKAQRWLAQFPPPLEDADVMHLLYSEPIPSILSPGTQKSSDSISSTHNEMIASRSQTW